MIDPLDSALVAMDRGYFEKSDIGNKSVIRARIRGLMRAYHKVWDEQNSKFQIVGSERLLLAPLRSLKTDRDSGYLAGGKLDLLVQETDGRKQLVLIDHKTFGSTFDDDDIEHLLVAAQQNTYSYLSHCNGMALDAAIWDCVLKPTHTPSKPSSRIVRAGKPERTLGRAYTHPSGTTYKKGDVAPAEEEVREATPGETIEEFEERVYQIMLESPAKFFARPRVPVIKYNIIDHVQEMYMWVRELDVDSKSETHLKNTDNCMRFNRACQYLGLCSGRSQEDDGTWERVGTRHAELDLPDGVDPFRVITNSRLSTFKSCRLQHHRRYNEGLVKIRQEPDENLYIGSAAHVGWEAMFKAYAANQGREL